MITDLRDAFTADLAARSDENRLHFEANAERLRETHAGDLVVVLGGRVVAHLDSADPEDVAEFLDDCKAAFGPAAMADAYVTRVREDGDSLVV